MNRLSLETLVPGIDHEDPPSVAQLAGRVPPITSWVTSAALAHQVHHENEIYPVINAYLSSIFPPARGFLIGPVAMLRPMVQASVDDNRSTASMEQSTDAGEGMGTLPFSSTRVVGRYADQRGVEKIAPDFVVYKISPSTADTFSKTILSIIKIKRPGSVYCGAVTQLLKHLCLAKDHDHDQELRSYLLVGDECTAVEFCRGGSDIVMVRSCSVPADPQENMTTELCKIAIKYWN